MLSAIIHSIHSYSALPLAWQQIHQRYVRSGPLVLGSALLNFPTPTTDRDRTVSRRSEPSSRATLMGEQLTSRMWRADIEVPNTTVYMNYWVVSACYPRGNFYPLSDDHSILNRLITKSCFRTCLTCRSRSQTPLYLYTLRMISNHSEGIFERLRYSLGGDRPSQTTHQTLSLYRIHGTRLEIQLAKGGIPKVTPLELAS